MRPNLKSTCLITSCKLCNKGKHRTRFQAPGRLKISPITSSQSAFRSAAQSQRSPYGHGGTREPHSLASLFRVPSNNEVASGSHIFTGEPATTNQSLLSHQTEETGRFPSLGVRLLLMCNERTMNALEAVSVKSVNAYFTT
eukprot:GHVN01000585.1.p1 GENE.GHVN01000585.1~~GHVN01000585.1.p1  ORF type:complete len:141 (+),score=7.64 GHVN01000585.1:312-734(+)